MTCWPCPPTQNSFPLQLFCVRYLKGDEECLILPESGYNKSRQRDASRICRLTLDWFEELLDLSIAREVKVPGTDMRVDGFFTAPNRPLNHALFAEIQQDQRVVLEVDGCVSGFMDKW